MTQFSGSSWEPDRRFFLSLMSTAIGSAAFGWSGLARAATTPLLATPDQVAAEKLILKLLKDPDLIKLQGQIKAEIAQSTIGKTPDGAATLDRAVAQWTNSLLFAEICTHRKTPAFLWGTDDTSRTWLGHTLGGVGTSGDDPDDIYRTAIIDGTKSYEMLGWIDQKNPAVGIVIQVDSADMTHPASMMDMKSKMPSVVSATLALLTDHDLKIGPDGSFRITLGGSEQGPNHVALKPGGITLGIRDMLSDWHQRPARLEVREIGSTAGTSGAETLDEAAIKSNTIQDLPDYIRFWSKFPEIWFGGLKPNTISEPRGRNGGWGYVAGLNFNLAPGEAALVTTSRGGFAYTGFQLNDPWMIAPDARRNLVCLNLSQLTANPDGTYTYVISPTDPGVANWLDTVGLHAGIGILRWQAPPASGSPPKDGLIREFKIIKLADLAAMKDIPRVTPEQRRKQIAARAEAYNARVT